MADLEKTVAIIFQGMDRTSGALGEINSGMDKLGGESTAAQTKVKGLEDQLADLGKTGDKLDSLVDVMRALAGAVVVKEFIDANIQAETFQRTMTLLTGSSRAAGEEFIYVRALANTLGLELFDTANAYAQLSAATNNTALEGQNTRFIFEAVASSMSALGKSSDATEGALLAVTQMISKGKVSMEELNGQLGERLPGALNLAADALGLTTSQLSELVSSGKLATEDFLPKFAEQLERVYGGVQQVDTFQAAWDRMGNTLKEISIDIGESGVMYAATKGIEALSFAIVSTTSAAQFMGTAVRTVLDLLVTADVSRYMAANAAASEQFAASTKRSHDALFEVNTQLQTTGRAAVDAGAALQEGLGKGKDSAKLLKDAAKEADEQLKALGLDPAKFKDDLAQTSAEVVTAFEKLAANPAVKGDSLLAGFLVSVDKLKGADLDAVGMAMQDAFQKGRLSAEQLEAATNALETKQQGLWGAMNIVTESSTKQVAALKKQQDETDKAKEKTEKYALEMEKLASNERIKVVESVFKLDIADVEAQAAIATSIIDSIGTAYTADVGVIGELMAQVTDGYRLADRTRQMLAMEADARTEQLHRAQMDLISAQVDYMRAKTSAVDNGSPLVTIQADGLKPHLEAFMWEILKEIQVKMAYDGGDMLTGGCTL